MNYKIKVYLDAGASIKNLKNYYSVLEFYQFPYDSTDRPKKAIKNEIIKLAIPSNPQWKDCNQTWKESNFTIEQLKPTCYYPLLKESIEKNSKKPKEKIRRDILHLDSAIKMSCKIFITSDREDILSNRDSIKNIYNLEIFQSDVEDSKLIEYIENILAKNY